MQYSLDDVEEAERALEAIKIAPSQEHFDALASLLSRMRSAAPHRLSNGQREALCPNPACKVVCITAQQYGAKHRCPFCHEDVEVADPQGPPGKHFPKTPKEPPQYLHFNCPKCQALMQIRPDGVAAVESEES